jgi:hypothetical protein
MYINVSNVVTDIQSYFTTSLMICEMVLGRMLVIGGISKSRIGSSGNHGVSGQADIQWRL